MKFISTVAIIFFTSPVFHIHAKPAPVTVLSVRSDILYFKVDKSFIGATVEVHDPSGQLIYTEIVKHHKTLIDFYDQSPGIYTVVVRKDSNKVDLVYNKQSDEKALTAMPGKV